MPITGVKHRTNDYQITVDFFVPEGVEVNGEQLLEDLKGVINGTQVKNDPRGLAMRIRDNLGVKMFLDYDVPWYRVHAMSSNGVFWELTSVENEEE